MAMLPLRRKLLLASVCGLAFPRALPAQPRTVRVGILSGLPRDKSLFTPLILKALASRGYREGQTMALEFRSADGKALKDADSSTPVVVLASEYDPVEKGIVKSFARPGGNITGVFAPARTLLAKNLEIAREILPGAERFLVLRIPSRMINFPSCAK
ncbi:MAG: ABC transporter substrate binding protein [Betaproteobacteria bacterium]